MATRQYLFGPFVLDDGRAALLRDGSPVSVSGRGITLLRALLVADGQVVGKAVLMDAAWPKAAVEESNLTVQMAQLRKALGSEGDEWIATVPRVGYRFAGEFRVDDGGVVSATPPPPIAAPKPSVAVLPFTNMSSDPEQEFFADGLAEDLISDLSKVPGLVVIARNSSFTYKGRPVDVRSVARDLGVRYVIEGSVRRAASKLRVSAQLIDATDHRHLWVDRFDRDLADVFTLQDEIVGRIVNALADVLPSTARVVSRRAANVEAYDLFVRGRGFATQSPETVTRARQLLEMAVALDPQFAEAHAWLAMSHHFGRQYWGEGPDSVTSQTRAMAERAVALDAECADAHWVLGYIKAYDRELAQGLVEFETALRINPNHADAWALLADLRIFEGNAPEGLRCVERALRLNPYPPGYYYWLLGWAHYAAGNYQAAVDGLRHEGAQGTGAGRTLAAALAQLGRQEEAEKEARLFLEDLPHWSVGTWAATQAFINPADLQHFVDGYLKAGLPK